ncbi:MAG: FHA domain-containing protein [Chloroflexi bacterium]|nr:FHA domain-containing protein [Chloroflexota bacterium]
MDIALLALRLILLATLYLFLAAVLVLLAVDLGHRRRTSTGTPVEGRLVVVASEAPEIVAGAIFGLQRLTSIGRSPDNVVVVPDTFTSSRHSLLAWREGQWWLEDQGSRNNTFLNGHPITEPTVVSTGDLIGVGKTQFRLELG